jgi:hypothetical protein
LLSSTKISQQRSDFNGWIMPVVILLGLRGKGKGNREKGKGNNKKGPQRIAALKPKPCVIEKRSWILFFCFLNFTINSYTPILLYSYTPILLYLYKVIFNIYISIDRLYLFSKNIIAGYRNQYQNDAMSWIDHSFA